VNRPAVTASSIMVNYVNLDQISCPSDDAVRRFRDLENLGITDKQEKSMSARDSTPSGLSRLLLPRGSTELCLSLVRKTSLYQAGG
jgi:hypothetical protein